MTHLSTSPTLQTILHWNHVRGRKAHCLARIYRSDEKGIVVLCKIRGSDRVAALMLDLAGAVNALVPTLISLGIDPSSVRWLIHYGPFSDYEPLEQESWAEIAPAQQDDGCYSVDLASWKALEAEQVEALHQAIELTPVLDVLNVIGWTQR